MGKRLSKIYTRTGDDGTTGLGDGKRISKASLRVEVIGDVDELNSTLGLLLTESLQDEVRHVLAGVQHRLFDFGGELCLPNHRTITIEHVSALEQTLDKFNHDLKPLREFILPGGCRAAAYCHLARSICRRAERHLVKLHQVEPLPNYMMQYLNRLSDLLFVLARIVNLQAGEKDIFWEKNLPEEGL